MQGRSVCCKLLYAYVLAFSSAVLHRFEMSTRLSRTCRRLSSLQPSAQQLLMVQRLLLVVLQRSPLPQKIQLLAEAQQLACLTALQLSALGVCCDSAYLTFAVAARIRASCQPARLSLTTPYRTRCGIVRHHGASLWLTSQRLSTSCCASHSMYALSNKSSSHDSDGSSDDHSACKHA